MNAANARAALLGLTIAAAGAAAPLAAQADAGAFAAAVADYRAERFGAAFAVFQAQLAAAGDAAAPELRWNAALAALRLQRSADAEAAVQPWLASDDPGQRGAAEFVTAMAAFLRAERAALAAQLPDAEPLAWTMAVQAMERALAGFGRAVVARSGWPEAERNAERARARLAELQRLRDAAQAPAPKQEPDAPAPQPAPPQPPEPLPEDAALPLVQDPLSAAELAQLRQRIVRKDEAKRALRREQQQRGRAPGVRSW